MPLRAIIIGSDAEHFPALLADRNRAVMML
jgi:hypothetical protein